MVSWLCDRPTSLRWINTNPNRPLNILYSMPCRATCTFFHPFNLPWFFRPSSSGIKWSESHFHQWEILGFICLGPSSSSVKSPLNWTQSKPKTTTPSALKPSKILVKVMYAPLQLQEATKNLLEVVPLQVWLLEASFGTLELTCLEIEFPTKAKNFGAH